MQDLRLRVSRKLGLKDWIAVEVLVTKFQFNTTNYFWRILQDIKYISSDLNKTNSLRPTW
jgi:hypothetical protein